MFESIAEFLKQQDPDETKWVTLPESFFTKRSDSLDITIDMFSAIRDLYLYDNEKLRILKEALENEGDEIETDLVNDAVDSPIEQTDGRNPLDIFKEFFPESFKINAPTSAVLTSWLTALSLYYGEVGPNLLEGRVSIRVMDRLELIRADLMFYAGLTMAVTKGYIPEKRRLDSSAATRKQTAAERAAMVLEIHEKKLNGPDGAGADYEALSERSKAHSIFLQTEKNGQKIEEETIRKVLREIRLGIL
jgi:hypothetical protein